MNRFFFNTILLFAVATTPKTTFGQSPFHSESLVKYDLNNHTTDKTIPFDRSFTLIIEKLSTKNIESVEAYEVDFIHGNRILVENKIIDCDGQKQSKAVIDMDLRFNPYSDTLQIFFPPLKPNKNFDVLVIYKLPDPLRDALLDVNSKIASGDARASDAFDEFFKSTIDKRFDISSFAITDFSTYQQFYTDNIQIIYTEISDANKYITGGELSELQVQALDIATSTSVSDFKDGNKLMEVSKQSLWIFLETGLLDINNVFLPSNDALTTLPFGHLRLKNLESNLAFFDSIYQGIDRTLSKGTTSISIGSLSVLTSTLRNDLKEIREHLQTNRNFLKERMMSIASKTDKDKRIRTGSYLAGNTVSSDLKTAGGNVLFLDVGLSNIIAPSIVERTSYIPKLYWGVSIYFRPIDKNTRRNRFYTKFDPEENDGCRRNIKRNPDGSVKATLDSYGPDYDIASKWSIWQRLSLNIGLTIGSMNNKDFDNFYNNNSLLIGPAYRFARAFKFSAGVAMLKRTSKNPLISEKRFVLGYCASLSVDIDFIQGIKDVYSILFK